MRRVLLMATLLLAVAGVAPAYAHEDAADTIVRGKARAIDGERLRPMAHSDPLPALPTDAVVAAVERHELGMLEPAGTRAAARSQLPETWCGTETTVDDVANATHPAGTPDIKVVYAYASDQPNRFATVAGRLQATASLLSRFMAAESGGRKTLRFDMGTSCGPQYADIQVVQLPRTRAEYVVSGAPQFTLLAADVETATGLASPRNNLVYADGLRGSNGVGGTAWLIGADSATTTAHDDGALTAVVWGPTTLPATATYAEPSIALHEIGHNLGAVQNAAPHSTKAGHCFDEYDVMCYQDGGAANAMTHTCGTTTSTLGEVFDCGRDDFFNATPAAGSWLATHWNVYRSAHLGSCATELADTCGLADGAAPDITPPVNTTAAASSSWGRGSYEVALTASDDESGVGAFEWRVDGGAVHATARATVSGDGVHTLDTRVRDQASNWSAWRRETVRIDATAPVPRAHCPDDASSGTSCTIDADDATSGVADLRWRYGASSSQVVVTAWDAAGNRGVIEADISAPAVPQVVPSLRLERTTVRGRTITLRGRLAGGPSPLGLTVTGTVREGRRRTAVRFRLVARGRGVFDAVATLRRPPRKGASAQLVLRHAAADVSLRRTLPLRRGTTTIR